MAHRVALLVLLASVAQAQSALIAEGDSPPTVRNWTAPQTPIPVGSLVKPFLALAYGEAHEHRFPRVDCTGELCWYAPGHSELELEVAIEQSCNVYFRRLAEQTPEPVLRAVLERFRLPAPDAWAAPDNQADRDAWIGLGRSWRIAPLDLLAAYRELIVRRADSTVARVLRGMQLAAQSGTAEAVGRLLPGPALAKTGTAPSSTRNWGGDGFAFVAYPAADPRYTMLLRMDGRTGRQAAATAAETLRRLVQPPRTPR